MMTSGMTDSFSTCWKPTNAIFPISVQKCPGKEILSEV